MSDKLSIKNEMAQFDRKNRSFYDELTDEEKKKFSTYLMLKYGANVQGSSEMQAYYLRSVNENVNKHFFEINRHPKLQWLTCTTVSPAMGNQFHYWLKTKKKEGNNKNLKFIARLYPNAKTDELELLAEINDTASLQARARELGMDDREIKKELD